MTRPLVSLTRTKSQLAGSIGDGFWLLRLRIVSAHCALNILVTISNFKARSTKKLYPVRYHVAAAMDVEQAATISPIVSDSLGHNQRTLSNIRQLSSPLLGLCAGALCLESTTGFFFYIAGTLLTSLLIYLGPAQRQPQKYFGTSPNQEGQTGMSWAIIWEVTMGGVGIEAVMGFVMAWTLAFNLVGT